jgi:hypothetical protein
MINEGVPANDPIALTFQLGPQCSGSNHERVDARDGVESRVLRRNVQTVCNPSVTLLPQSEQNLLAAVKWRMGSRRTQRGLPDALTDEHQDRCDEEGYLRARTDRNGE